MKYIYHLKILGYDCSYKNSVEADDFIFKDYSIVFVRDVNGRYDFLAVYPSDKTIIEEIRINLD
jgi:hypothetical protein